MPDRFLLYSMRHNRPVKALLSLDKLKYETLTVIDMTATQLSYVTARRKTPQTVPLTAVLSVGYARGDDGDTLKNEQREKDSL